MIFSALRSAAYEANQRLFSSGLVILTWGNVSAIDRKENVLAIKPSGVSYDKLTPESIALVDLSTGKALPDSTAPSSDTPTHLELYRAFPDICGVVHTHSTYATSWCQAGKDLPCYGTTHADIFYGKVPLSDTISSDTLDEYEKRTGEIIVECFRKRILDPDKVPGVLVPWHGPFTWGKDADSAVENAQILEEIAHTAHITLAINPHAEKAPQYLIDKHFLRKHGPGAYYGQEASRKE